MTGILLLQLGTPDEPTAKGLRPYLKQFLADPRVIETRPDAKRYRTPGLKRIERTAPPRWLWNLILNGIIVPFRSPKSAAKYRRIWNAETGSPLLHYTQRQATLLQERFPNALVRFGMTYGSPAIDTVVDEMIAAGVDRIIAVPMYPQYSATTTAASTDALFDAMKNLRVVPGLRVVPPYYRHPAYLDAIIATIRDERAKLAWEPEHILFSFHGIPRKYVQRGDPYAGQCVETTQMLLDRLKLPKETWSRSFQSRLGRDPWLTPYTEEHCMKLAKDGVKKLLVVLPGFTADCLETLDEIGNEAAEAFHQSGGEQLRSCPCLNDHPKWIDALEAIVREEGAGWVT